MGKVIGFVCAAVGIFAATVVAVAVLKYKKVEEDFLPLESEEV